MIEHKAMMRLISECNQAEDTEDFAIELKNELDKVFDNINRKWKWRMSKIRGTYNLQYPTQKQLEQTEKAACWLAGRLER